MLNNRTLNRICAVLLIIALLIPAGPVSHARAEQSVSGVINAKELYMRTGPGTEYDKVTVAGREVILVYGQEVTVLAIRDGWYHIRAIFNGKVAEGYSLGSSSSGVPYIVLPEGADVTGEYRRGTVTAVELNVRKGPSTDFDILQNSGSNVVLKKDMTVSVIGENGDWYHILVDIGSTSVEGYCLGKYILLSEQEEPTVPVYAYGAVTATALNVRSGPSTEYDKVQKNGTNVVFGSGQKVTILEEVDGWYHISAEYDGGIVEGYCLGSYVNVTEGTPESGTLNNDKSVDVNEKDTPGEKDNKGSDGEKDDKNPDKKEEEGPYIPTSPIDFSHGVPAGYKIGTRTYVASLDYLGTVTAETGLNLRDFAETSSSVRAVLPKDTEVTVIRAVIKKTKDESGAAVNTRWYRVVAFVDGEYVAGYVVSDYISLDCSDGLLATTKYDKQKLLKKVGKTGVVRNSSNTIVKLSKGAELTIIGEETAADGTAYYKVNAVYKGEEVTGFIKKMRVTYVATVDSFSVEFLEIDPDYKEPSEDSDDSSENSGYTFDGANAKILNASGLTVHTEAKNASPILYTEDDKAVMLYTGDSVEIIDVTTEGDSIWCYVRLFFRGSQYYGYIRSTHIESDSDLLLMSTESFASSSALTFEAKLEREGFPESYREPLRALHEKYPSWEFKAFHTGLDWSEVIEHESEVGVNLIPNTKGVEWKSIAPGAYSWKTDTFVVFDGSTWVTASEDAIRYYMDPRNFLGEDTIFQFEVLSYSPTCQDINGVAEILKNTALSKTSYTYKDEFGEKRKLSYEDTFMMAAEYTGVSPYHLASRVKQEVTIGTNSLSNSVTAKVSGYEGLYNFYNIGAYHSTEPGGAIKNGLKYAQNGSGSVSMNKSCMIPWTNPFKAILGGAYFIGNNYVNRGQNTIYLQKFNVTTGENNTYGHQYMANVEAPYSEGIRVYRGYENLESTPVMFSIPVYLNMPETTCSVPEPTGNPNNWLKTLTIYDINGQKRALTPTFDFTEDQEYSLIVDSSVDYLKIKTTTVSSLAKVTSAKNVYPEPGMNRIVVKVKAENGDVRKYIINVFREEPEVPEEPIENIGDDPAENIEDDPVEGTDDTVTDGENGESFGTDIEETSGDVLPDTSGADDADTSEGANTDTSEAAEQENNGGSDDDTTVNPDAVEDTGNMEETGSITETGADDNGENLETKPGEVFDLPDE